MNNADIKTIKETFARLFVIAVQNKINFASFTFMLERSELIEKIENKAYDDYFNHSIKDLFYDITNYCVDEDTSYGIYNDAYWCGFSYYELFIRLKKPFSYIFLKLSFSKMIDIYSIYHEMDISSLINYFLQIEKEKTILRVLCEQKGCSLSKLSEETGISHNTISKYNASDDALYNASFQTIIKIAKYFSAPFSLFIKEI